MRMRAGTDRGTPDAGTETRERARARVGMVVALVGSIAVACSSGAADGSSPSPSTALTPIVRPSTTGEIAITSPKNGATIQGSDVPVEIDLEGATLVVETTNFGGKGWIALKANGGPTKESPSRIFPKDLSPRSFLIFSAPSSLACAERCAASAATASGKKSRERNCDPESATEV